MFLPNHSFKAGHTNRDQKDNDKSGLLGVGPFFVE